MTKCVAIELAGKRHWLERRRRFRLQPVEEESHRLAVFFDIQSNLPRQGPGDDDSTLRALSLCRDLPRRPAVLDVGCGPGMQTLTLAKKLNTTVVAADLHEQYLNELRIRAAAAGLEDRVEVRREDMRSLPFKSGAFDLVWAEGSAYNMGFESALTAWRPLLKPSGYVALSELVWLQPDAPLEVRSFFEREYPPMTDVATNLETIRRCGYDTVGHFTLPNDAWWKYYYTPLEARLAKLAAKYAADPVALEVIATSEAEIDMRRRHPQIYGYEFFVAQRTDRRRSGG